MSRLTAARRAAVIAAVAALLVAACDDDPGGGPATGPSDPPTLGAQAPLPSAAPTGPMDDLERPIAARLSRQVRPEGLHLDYLDCPDWHGELPGRMVCDGYLDGVVAKVDVRLRGARGGPVRFDARLAEGVISTRTLVERLQRQGYSAVDCGAVDAYPIVIGTELVCRVHRSGRTGYVVATVADRQGGVTIRDYRAR